MDRIRSVVRQQVRTLREPGFGLEVGQFASEAAAEFALTGHFNQSAVAASIGAVASTIAMARLGILKSSVTGAGTKAAAR